MAYAVKVPAYLVFKPAKTGLSLVDGTNAPAGSRFPSADGMLVAKMVHKLLSEGVQVNEYAFFCPKYDAEGKTVYQTDTKGHVVLSPKGKALIEMVDLGRALKEAADGKREARISKGMFGTFRVSLVAPSKQTVKREEFFDISSFFPKDEA
jgi:hypothetical protein